MAGREFSATDVTALAATLAAVAAVAVSVWDHVQQRKFNRLSVVPRLDYTLEKSGSTAGAVRLANEGVGPAEIRLLEIGFCGDDRSQPFESWNAARASMEDHGLTLVRYHDLKREEIVGQGHTLEWARFQSRDPTEAGDPIQMLIDDLAFRIRYASIYDETFSLERQPECLAP